MQRILWKGQDRDWKISDSFARSLHLGVQMAVYSTEVLCYSPAVPRDVPEGPGNINEVPREVCPDYTNRYGGQDGFVKHREQSQVGPYDNPVAKVLESKWGTREARFRGTTILSPESDV